MKTEGEKRQIKDGEKQTSTISKLKLAGMEILADLLTSCVWVMEVRVQAFFQEP